MCTRNLREIYQSWNGLIDRLIQEEFINAVEAGSIDLCKQWLEAGANIYEANNYALRYSIQMGHEELVDFLLDNCSITQSNSYQYLKLALNNQYYQIAKKLISSGAIDLHPSRVLLLDFFYEEKWFEFSLIIHYDLTTYEKVVKYRELYDRALFSPRGFMNLDEIGTPDSFF